MVQFPAGPRTVSFFLMV